MSRVIGNDLNLISRNVLQVRIWFGVLLNIARPVFEKLTHHFLNVSQGAGALIYLLVLSWPLGLCTLLICATLSTIMLVHGRYKFAYLTQAICSFALVSFYSILCAARVVHFWKGMSEKFICWFASLVHMRELGPSHCYLIGRFQKRAAKFAQEFTASANNVRFVIMQICHFQKPNPFSTLRINFLLH